MRGSSTLGGYEEHEKQRQGQPVSTGVVQSRDDQATNQGGNIRAGTSDASRSQSITLNLDSKDSIPEAAEALGHNAGAVMNKAKSHRWPAARRFAPLAFR